MGNEKEGTGDNEVPNLGYSAWGDTNGLRLDYQNLKELGVEVISTA